MRLLALLLALCALACASGPRPHPDHKPLRTGATTAEQASRSAQAADKSLVRYASSNDPPDVTAEPASATPEAQPQPVEAP
jgi:hypothetical protein